MHRLRHVFERRNLVTAAPGASVYEVAATMSAGGVGAVPIVEGDRLVGIFSERDLMTRVVVPRRDPERTLVSEVMTHEVVTATLEDHVDFCVEKMRKAGCRHLPVLAGDRVIGVFSMRDLLRDELEEQDVELRNLRAYLHQTPVS
jgi:CBS domain-containing protein